MEHVNWKPLLGFHLAVFVPLIAIAGGVGGYPALIGGLIAFAIVFGANLFLWSL